MDKNKIVYIHTDGACSGNQNDENLGGWGAILEYGKHSKELYGGEPNTTNNRMEMSALIAALEALNKKGLTIKVFSDSSYLLKCLRDKWYLKWQLNGWKTSSRKPVENQDLWEKLLALIEGQEISYYLVKGHINIDSKSVNLNKIYAKFVDNNGDEFSYDDFLYFTGRNNLADELANKGISEITPIEPSTTDE